MTDAIPASQDRIGRILLALSSVSAIGAFAGGLAAVRGALPQLVWLETWRSPSCS